MIMIIDGCHVESILAYKIQPGMDFDMVRLACPTPGMDNGIGIVVRRGHLPASSHVSLVKTET